MTAMDTPQELHIRGVYRSTKDEFAAIAREIQVPQAELLRRLLVLRRTLIDDEDVAPLHAAGLVAP